MPYVMVPVPEEHVEEVMRIIVRARAHAMPWDRESLTALFLDVDEASRSVLAFVARAGVDDGELTDVEAARLVQLTVREIMEIRNELNDRAVEASRQRLIAVQVVSEQLPNGRTIEKRVLKMEPEVAEMVRAAEQAELLDG